LPARVFLALALMLAGTTVPPPSPTPIPAKEPCTWFTATDGTCREIDATTTDDEAILELDQSATAGDEDVDDDDDDAGAPRSRLEPQPLATSTATPRTTTVDNMGGLGQRMIVGDLANATIERGPWEMIYVTLEDIARFRPNAGIAKMEPKGWAIRGVPANFWIETTAQILEGELLDMPASVRFTPLRYRWDYGDGERVTLSAAGGSWAELGVDEFAETPASHPFAESGVYVAQPSVDFTVEYQFGPGEWIPIDGVVRAQASPLTVVVTGAATVLVANDCVTAPRGPGC
jgi:hypothetical protein